MKLHYHCKHIDYVWWVDWMIFTLFVDFSSILSHFLSPSSASLNPLDRPVTLCTQYFLSNPNRMLIARWTKRLQLKKKIGRFYRWNEFLNSIFCTKSSNEFSARLRETLFCGSAQTFSKEEGYRTAHMCWCFHSTGQIRYIQLVHTYISYNHMKTHSRAHRARTHTDTHTVERKNRTVKMVIVCVCFFFPFFLWCEM